MSQPAVQVRGVSMSYKGRQVLGGVDMEIPKGEICGLLGPNGAGKTTLLKIITGLTPPDRGEVRLFGEPFRPELLRCTGCLVDRPGLYRNRTAGENLRIRQTLLGIPQDKVEETLRLVGLEKAGKKPVGRFSQGMKQRLGVALALMGNPDLLILDEPTGGLDAQGIYDLRTLLTGLNRDRGVTILITSHMLDEVARVATSYAFLQGGGLRQMSGEQVEENTRRYAWVRTGDSAAAAVVLDRFVTGPKGYEVQPDGSFRLWEALDRLPQLNAALVEKGIPVWGFGLKAQSLSDFYLAETGTVKGGEGDA